MEMKWNMTFLRIKKIKSNEYGYVVENTWTSKGPRQEVKQYLGRVYRFEGKGDSALNLKGNKRELLMELIKFELNKVNKELAKEKINFDWEKLKFIKNDKSCVLALNEGLMCSYTLARILGFKKTREIEQDSVVLAKYFIEAGLAVPKEAFIAFFERL